MTYCFCKVLFFKCKTKCAADRIYLLIDFKKRVIFVKYGLDYEGKKEMFDDLNKKRNDLTGKRVQCNGLSEFNENILE